MMVEWLDIYDSDLNHIGTKARHEVHRDGDWHQVFQCWVVAFWQDELYLILQRRAHNKDVFPNLIDVSAAGHFTAGETIRDAMRELKEEIGLDVPFQRLHKIARRRYETHLASIIDREFANVYMVLCDQPLADYRPDPNEVADLVAVPALELVQLFDNQRTSLQAQSFNDDTVTLTQSDFVPNTPQFYKDIFQHIIEAWHVIQLENPLAVPKILKFGF
jgi:isopentenyldiphosphate isomerase